MSDVGFTLLWSKTLRSSLWVKESKETRLVWLTMLMLKNADGMVVCSLPGLADAAKVTEPECEAAVEVLLSPDPKSTSKAEEGRRILEVPGGWRIVNSDFYRFSTEAKRAFWAQQKAEQRAREPQAAKKVVRRKKGSPLAGEAGYVKDVENHGFEEADAKMDRQTEGYSELIRRGKEPAAEEGESEKAKVFPPPPAPVHAEQGNVAPYIGGVAEPEPEREDDNGDRRFNITGQ